ncbi:hypothetical protein BD749_3504 [Pontibacter ramchanderi]|uniref:Uncharacterized protein n=1 Tax=Pontibacter ramchanderi TaxID=1179743 RepID=A0A2N3U7A0_9BACT|nr:hypothetical protein BD749_3504 [Pontibacter ramchanderi]
MNKFRNRLLFIILTCFLIIQFLFILKVSEPYPAIKFPGFGSIPQTEGQIQAINYELFTYINAYDSTAVSAYDLFEGYPKTYVP